MRTELKKRDGLTVTDFIDQTYILAEKLEVDKNYYPDTVLDIGTHHGHWADSIKKIYNNSKYYLFEAIDYNELNRFLI